MGNVMNKAGSLIDTELFSATEPFPVRFGTASFVFFVASHDRDGIHYARRADGGLWGNVSKLPHIDQKSSTSVAAVEYQQRLYVFWHERRSSRFFVMSSADGANWSAPTNISDAIGGVMGIGGRHDPVVAVYDARIFLFWRGLREDEGIFHATFDGTAWTYHDNLQRLLPGQKVVPGTPPAAAVAAGKLFVFWAHRGSSEIHHATLDASGWHEKGSLAASIDAHGIRNGWGPVASQLDDGFLLTWDGSGNDGHWWVLHRGGAFQGKQQRIRAIALQTASPVRAILVPHGDDHAVELYWNGVRGGGSFLLFFRRMRDRAEWLADYAGDLSLGDLPLPGAHDSASFLPSVMPANKEGGSREHPYVCQTLPIAEQLAQGVRLIDLRIRIDAKLDGTDGNVTDAEFWTCHGGIRLGIDANKFQSLETALREIFDFVHAHATETVVVLMAIDDERYSAYGGWWPFRGWYEVDRHKEKPEVQALKKRIEHQVRTRLAGLFAPYRTMIVNPGRSKTLPSLGESRGRILLLRRFDCDDALNLGDHINWETVKTVTYSDWKKSTFIKQAPPVATPPAPVAAKPVPGGVKMAIQDRFDEISFADKIEAFRKASSDHPDADILFNYASFTAGTFSLGKPLIQADLIAQAASGIVPMARTGWALFDFVTYLEPHPQTGEAVNAVDLMLGDL
jgi:hypothetical protein